ncbi:MAG: protein kinase [Candidatus Hydrogenedentes bacterium]|nr:protein kinase [Candidatus Hydrogenedentota bacterium]
MGAVYLARDTALNRAVALKVLLGSLARNPAMVRSFHREAQAAAPLRHPNIVRVYAAGIQAGTPFIAMEYVAGETLERFLRRKGQVTWQTALYIGGQVAEALGCAHRAGIIHRDVKPANILLDRSGRVRLTDFGIANAATHETQGVVGTPQYMSPEQLRGIKLTCATDLFSLGVVMYQMMAGKPPFQADTPVALINRITTEEPARLNRLRADVPDDVARLVALLLEKSPENRPASAEAVVASIERLQQENGGRSVIPDALSAYVKEQTNAPALRLLTPLPQTAPGKPKARPSGTKRVMQAMAVVAVGVTVLTALVFGLMPAAQQPHEAPVLDAFVFEGESPLVGGLPASSYRFADVNWMPDKLAVEIRADGRADTLAYGVSGVLAVDPQERICRSVVSPGQPIAASCAYHPNGVTHCAVVNAENGTQSLVELDVASLDHADPQARHLIQGVRLAPGSVRYTPDGARIGYVRIETNHEFWLIDRASDTTKGTLLSVGLTGDRFAFSPDGSLAAIMLPSETGSEEPDIYVIETERGEIRNRLGTGFIDMTSWHPSGTHLLVCSAAGSEKRQLWRVPVDGGQRQRVTEMPEGVGSRLAVSPAGDWVAVLTNQHAQASVAFVRLNEAGNSVPAQTASLSGSEGSSHA